MPWSAAAISAAPSIVSGAAGLIGGSKANSAAKQAATVAFDRQKWMMMNAHQLQVADMKKAGLNPRLSVMGGQGAHASAPQSSTAQNVEGPAAASAIDAMRQMAEIKNIKEQNNNLKAQSSASIASAKLLDAQARGTNYENVGKAVNAGWAERFGVTGSNTQSAIQAARATTNAAKGLWNFIHPRNLIAPFKRK